MHFDQKALRNVCSVFHHEEAVAEIERLKRGASPFVRNNMALKNASKHQWTSYSDERGWLASVESDFPS